MTLWTRSYSLNRARGPVAAPQTANRESKDHERTPSERTVVESPIEGKAEETGLETAKEDLTLAEEEKAA